MEAVSYSHSSSSTGECTHPPITKKKRTQRPKTAAIATSSNSEVDDIISTTTTEEDEDMARCLILLAQGNASNQHTASDAVEKDGVYVYECKTCTRSFTSFQALGGHRASHKKPKMETAAATTTANREDRKDGFDFHILKNNNNNNNKKMRVHECSICGAEFSSGQALGGHMRRHRQIISPEKLNASQEVVVEKEEEKRVFSLDLNLPAPSDENPRVMGFLLGDQRSTTIPSPLIDCHY